MTVAPTSSASWADVDHERLVIARDLTGLLLGKHGDGIVAVGVHGSVARADDSAYSDFF